jgi:cobalamin biosynthesis Mg chelatase CobN
MPFAPPGYNAETSEEADPRDNSPMWGVVLFAALVVGGAVIGIYFFRGGKLPW